MCYVLRTPYLALCDAVEEGHLFSSALTGVGEVRPVNVSKPRSRLTPSYRRKVGARYAFCIRAPTLLTGHFMATVVIDGLSERGSDLNELSNSVGSPDCCLDLPFPSLLRIVVPRGQDPLWTS